MTARILITLSLIWVVSTSSLAEAATEVWSSPLQVEGIGSSFLRRPLVEIARFNENVAATVYANGYRIRGAWYDTSSGVAISDTQLFIDGTPSNVWAQVRKATSGLSYDSTICGGNGAATFFVGSAGYSSKVYRAEMCNLPKAMRFVLAGSVAGDSLAPSVAMRGLDGVLAYARENRVYVQRLNADGTFLGTEQLVYTDARGTSFQGKFSDLIWNGTRYVLAIALTDGYAGVRPCLVTMTLSATGSVTTLGTTIGQCHGEAGGHYTSAAYVPNTPSRTMLRWYQGWFNGTDNKHVYVLDEFGTVVSTAPVHPYYSIYTTLVTAGLLGLPYQYYTAGRAFGDSDPIKFYGYSLTSTIWSFLGQLPSGVPLAMEFNIDGVLFVWQPVSLPVRISKITF